MMGAARGTGTTEGGDSNGILSQRGRSILLLIMTREGKIFPGFPPSPLVYYTSSSLGQKFPGASCQRSLKNGVPSNPEEIGEGQVMYLRTNK